MSPDDSKADKEVKPALTEDEWDNSATVSGHALLARLTSGLTLYVADEYDNIVYVPQPEFHALAALALYGQPWGFEHRHVEALRALVNYGRGLESHGFGGMVKAADEAITRIELLLPPRTEG